MIMKNVRVVIERLSGEEVGNPFLGGEFRAARLSVSRAGALAPGIV